MTAEARAAYDAAASYKTRSDFLGEPFEVRLFDVEGAGVAAVVFSSEPSANNTLKFSRVFSAHELQAAGVRKTLEGYAALADALELVEDAFWTAPDAEAAGEGELAAFQLSAALPGIRPPPPIVSLQAARAYFARAPVGLSAWNASSLPGEHSLLLDVLAKGLAELCRHKPAGLEAVSWLAHWLLEHNPAQPKVQVD